jgi:hypothetical protein
MTTANITNRYVIEKIQAYQPIDKYTLQNLLSIALDADIDLEELEETLEYLSDVNIISAKRGNYEMSNRWKYSMDDEDREFWLAFN